MRNVSLIVVNGCDGCLFGGVWLLFNVLVVFMYFKVIGVVSMMIGLKVVSEMLNYGWKWFWYDVMLLVLYNILLVILMLLKMILFIILCVIGVFWLVIVKVDLFMLSVMISDSDGSMG